MDNFWCLSLEDVGIDAYLVKEYPIDHPKYPAFKSEQELWLDRYGYDRNGHPKGFIKIIFSK